MKVAVGISGGVDSAVAALLLKEAGHELVGVTMTLGRADEAKSLAEAREVAAWLGVPLHELDLAEVWHRDVLAFATESYRAGQTPNPCVRCNERVKFNLLPRWAFETLGCDLFATGHYARVEHGRLFRGVDRAKDQSYFLYRVPHDILQRTLFPLGALTKAEVRARAKAAAFPVADHADSQDFCGADPRLALGDRPPTFGDRPHIDGDRPHGKGVCPQDGEIVTVEGKVIGHHDGYWHYTVGQRKGLGVGGGTPYYVISLDSAKNRVIVGTKAQSVCRSFRVSEFLFVGTDPRILGTDPTKGGPVPLFVKVRSAGEPRGPVTFDGEICQCPDGIAGVAPGQSAVFYDGDEIVGGGVIS